MLKSATRQRAAISVRGVVQGVGFRPFVYRLAAAHHLSGWVRNTSGKVEIEVEGGKIAIRDFLEELPKQAPPMSRIEDIQIKYLSPAGLRRFPHSGKPRSSQSVSTGFPGHCHLCRVP